VPYLHPDGIVVFDDWNMEAVNLAIRQIRYKLPKLLGAVGKDLVFTNSNEVRNSELGSQLGRIYRRLEFLRRVKSFKSLMKL